MAIWQGETKVPDGSSHPFLSQDLIGRDPISYEWTGTKSQPIASAESREASSARAVESENLSPLINPSESAKQEPGQHTEIVAAARAAEHNADQVAARIIDSVRRENDPGERNPADPLDQVAADWAASVEADQKIIHAFLGIDDPVGREAAELFTDIAVEAELTAFLNTLPEGHLARGELAALDAFDAAVGEGADAQEALSIAIMAAESSRGPESGPEVEDIIPPLARVSDLAASHQLLKLAETAASEKQSASAESQSSEQGTSAPAEPAPYVVPPLSLSGLAGLGVGGTLLADPAFGFGFTFAFDAAPVFRPGGHALSRSERNEPVETAPEASADNSVLGSSVSDFLIGTSAAEIFAAREANDYIYTDTPDNYDSATHSLANPLTDPIFSASGASDIASAGAGDDSLWGGAGDDQLHGDVPESGDNLFTQFSFPLGLAASGDDYIDGGAGDDTLWGGGGADVLYGGGGDDSLDGGGGIDTLYGGAGDDNLFGYAGDDLISGGAGADALSGGSGADEFEFSGGSGAAPLEHARSLGTDTISDYSVTDNDTFSLSDADFALGNSGTLTLGSDYFEYTSVAIDGTAQDLSGGVANAGVVILGANTGTDGVQVYYTEDASQMTSSNSYQIADLISANASDVDASDFLLRT